MNKKGFTLIELLVVMTLIAVVSVISTPNVVQMVENGRDQKIIKDANNFLNDVKSKSTLKKYSSFYPNSSNLTTEICANNTSFAQDLDKDPYGNYYDKNLCCVKITLENNEYKYYIKLVSIDKDGNYSKGVSSSTTSVSYVLSDDITVVSYD